RGGARMCVLSWWWYGAVGDLLFRSVLGYAVGFFAGLGVPKGIDQGPGAAVPAAAGIDLLLLLLFAVQHTVMARPWFKRRWTRIVPEPAERTTFVLAASLVLALLFWLWQPIGGTVWSLSGPAAGTLWAVYTAGWAAAVTSTFLVSHCDLFGLRQAWLHARRVSQQCVISGRCLQPVAVLHADHRRDRPRLGQLLRADPGYA